MTSGYEGTTSKAFAFGPFKFLPKQQLLLDGDVPVRLGARALEVLLALVERPGELVGKDELLSRAWPGAFVEDNNLKVNVAALRRALGEAHERPRYIATVNGRGYRFVSPVEVLVDHGSTAPIPMQHAHRQNLPLQSTRIVGQEQSIAELRRRLDESRLITIVGAGGIGKTTVALEVARSVAEAFQHGAWLVDLAPLTDPALVAGAIAAVLGLTVHSADTNPALIAYLRDKRLVIVVDNCEHVIDAAAEVAERIVATAPAVHLIATSREPLRVRSEYVYRLSPLGTPSQLAGLSAADARAFAAVELFEERASRNASEFRLNDTNAPLVGQICRSLDGIPLAIELAATRISSLGIETLSVGLADRFQLLNQGDRSSPARQRTLYATLDWSYQLLTVTERSVLQRLSLFAGAFDLKAAIAVGADGAILQNDVVDAVDNLVAKSLVSTSREKVAQYRLLEATRAYAREKLIEQNELAKYAARHAEYFREELRQAEIELRATANEEWLEKYSRKIDDVRSALTWAFSASGSRALGTSIVVQATPLWSRMSLLEECLTWVMQAVSSPSLLKEIPDRDKMALYAAFGATWLYTRDAGPQAKNALSKSLHLAEKLGNTPYLMRALWKLAYCSLYIGKHSVALELATRLQDIARVAGDVAGKRDGDRTVAAALHYMGQHARAREILERYIDDDVMLAEGPRLARFQLDHRVSFHCTLAHVLFVQGFADQALQSIEIAINEAKALGHPLSLGSILVLAAVPVALYRGDLSEAERLLAMLMDLVAKHGLVFWSAMTDCLYSSLLIMKGDETGVDSLKHALESLRAVHFGVRYPAFLGFLAHGLGTTGRRKEAFETIETALRWSKRHEELWCVPELIRIKGELLRADDAAGSGRAAEVELLRAIALARRQHALSWELRAGIDLARLWHRTGKTSKARSLLLTICGRFSEGHETTDMLAAQALIRQLDSA